jgi:hypothetical protein
MNASAKPDADPVAERRGGRLALPGVASAGPFGPLTRFEWWAVWVGLPLLVVGFGVVTLARAVGMSRPMTDADVFFRAAWAIRSGADVYTITDTNGWHYLYPALFAILMAPFANPPPGELLPGGAEPWPFAWMVVAWYLLGVVFLAVASHWVARAVELSSDDPMVRQTPPFCRRWWSLRIWPALVLAIALGSTLSRGQVNTLLLMLIAGSILSAVRGWRFTAGLWLAGAITLKVIPAFLLLYPLWRRDWRWLAGSAVGLVVGLWVLPALTIGPSLTWHYNWRWVEVMLLDRFSAQEAASRFAELHTLRKIDNQSPFSVMHHLWWFGTPLDQRPEVAAWWTKLAHLAFAGVVTLATMWAAGLWRTRAATGREHVPLVVGMLLSVLLVASPVVHPDYFGLLLPLVAVWWSLAMQGTLSAEVPRAAWVIVGLYVLANLLPRFEGLWELKMYGLAMFAGLGWWVLGLVLLRRGGGYHGLGWPVGGARVAKAGGVGRDGSGGPP